MPALSPFTVRATGFLHLCVVERNDFDAGSREQQIELAAAVVAETSLDGQRRLEQRCRGEQARGVRVPCKLCDHRVADAAKDPGPSKPLNPVRNTSRLLVVTILFVACQWSEDRYIRRAVREHEVHGRWQITPTGEEGLRFAGIKTEADQFIEVRPDHTCRIRAYDNFHNAQAAIVQSSCMWQIRRAKHQKLEIRAESASWSFYFDEEGGRLLLWAYTTDPDQWRYYEFARVESLPGNH